MIDVKGRWALITGAARGIGRLAAIFMADRGCNLILHARKAENCAKVASSRSHSYFKSSVSVSIIFLTSTGFAMWAFIPTDKAFSTSSLKAFAVIATMGISFA